MSELNLGDNYDIDEDSNDNLVISHSTNGDILRYDPSTDSISTLKTIDALSTDTILNRPDWVEDANSPFNLSGSPSVSGSLADTGFTQYLVLLAVEADNDVQMRSSGVTATDAYDTLFNDDSRTGNGSDFTFSPGTFTGSILIDVREPFSKHSYRFNIVQTFAQTGMPVAGSNNNAGDFTSFTFEDSGGGTVDATVEVFHR